MLILCGHHSTKLYRKMGLLASMEYQRILLVREPERRTSLHLFSQVGTSYAGVHLILLPHRWRSPTDAILECRTDMHTGVAGMRLPNTDDNTWHDDKWRGTVE
jgi:hypothetical protein